MVIIQHMKQTFMCRPFKCLTLKQHKSNLTPCSGILVQSEIHYKSIQASFRSQTSQHFSTMQNPLLLARTMETSLRTPFMTGTLHSWMHNATSSLAERDESRTDDIWCYSEDRAQIQQRRSVPDKLAEGRFSVLASAWRITKMQPSFSCPGGTILC